jgi:hypothetical protein
VPFVLVDPLIREPADEGEICLELQVNPLDLLTGCLRDPKMISGKIRRAELRRREDEASQSGTPIATEYRYEDLVGWEKP